MDPRRVRGASTRRRTRLVSVVLFPTCHITSAQSAAKCLFVCNTQLQTANSRPKSAQDTDSRAKWSKPSVDAMAPTPDGRGVRASRQQPPVSCRFCRTRKLRCNREQPCSNCISRGLPCQLPGTARQGTSAAVPEQTPPTPGELSEPQPHPGTSVEPDIMQRLEALERNLIALHKEREQSLKAAEPEHIQGPPASGSAQSGLCGPVGSSLPSGPLAPGPQMTYQLEEFRAHLGWLDHLTEAREHAVRLKMKLGGESMGCELTCL